MADIFLTNVEAVIEVQDKGAGNGARNIVDLSSGVKPALGGFSKSFGSITRGYRLSPRTNKPVPLPVRRDQPEAITPELTCKMIAANYMEKFGADSRFALYVRHPARVPSDPLDYARVDILTDVAVDGFNFGDFVADEPNTDNITLTVPLNAANHVRVLPVVGKALSTAFSSANDCNVVAADIDDEGTVFAVTAADAVGLKPYLLKSDDDGATWTEIELTDLSVDCTAIAVAGDYLIIAAGTTIAVYDKSGSQLGAYTAAGTVNAVAAIDAANIVAVGAAGLVLKSEDGGYNWTALTSGTSEGLNAIAARNLNKWYAGGTNGTLLKYNNGTISAIALPGALSAVAVNTVALPDSPAGFSRDDDIYIGMANGTVYKTTDGGTNWSQVSFPGSGSGAVTDLKFVEFLGQVLYILHTGAGGASTILRDWSGGAGGNNNVESLTSPINSGHAVIVPVDANNAYVLGAIHSSAELVVKVETA